MADRYVRIATQSTTQAKYWNNPHGWRELVRFLKDAGYVVVCVDQKPGLWRPPFSLTVVLVAVPFSIY